jgi:hypothetical protein
VLQVKRGEEAGEKHRAVVGFAHNFMAVIQRAVADQESIAPGEPGTRRGCRNDL